MSKKVLIKILCVGLACWMAMAGILALFPVRVDANTGTNNHPVITPFDIGETGRPPGRLPPLRP